MTGLLLGLVMIVKDEAHGVAETLRSVLPYVDRWTILDTGSIDGTQDIVREVMRDRPGSLVEHPFDDLAASRNRVIEAHGASTRYAFMIDSDDVLVKAEGLRSMLESEPEDVLWITLRRDHVRYRLPLIFRTGAGYWYEGRAHDRLVPPRGKDLGCHVVPDAVLTQNPPPQSQEASRRRWTWDAEMLEEEVRRDPFDGRSVYYLARTYEFLGRPHEAEEMYARRITINDASCDRFDALRRRARILCTNLSRADEAMNLYGLARLLRPDRAEPLYEIAHLLMRLGRTEEAFSIASNALRIPVPEDDLTFLDEDVYAWRLHDVIASTAFYLGPERRHIGLRSARIAAEHAPEDERVLENLSCYERLQLAEPG